MKYDPKNHHRRSIRLQHYDYSQEGYYYITICTKDREHWFGKIFNKEIKLSGVGEIVKKSWIEIPKHFDNVFLDVYVVMPEHFHGIVVIENERNAPCRGLINQTPTNQTSTKWILQKNPKMVLGKIIRYFKAKTSFMIHKIGYHNFAWQRNYYEHIIRNEKELYSKRKYIINNPLQWKLDHKNFLTSHATGTDLSSFCDIIATPRSVT